MTSPRDDLVVESILQQFLSLQAPYWGLLLRVAIKMKLAGPRPQNRSQLGLKMGLDFLCALSASFKLTD